MAVMWWWAVPLTTTLTAWAVVLWRSRASLHRDPVVTVQRLSRFRGAMARMHADGTPTWHADGLNSESTKTGDGVDRVTGLPRRDSDRSAS